MDCPHCSKIVHIQFQRTYIAEDHQLIEADQDGAFEGGYAIEIGACPACYKVVIMIIVGMLQYNTSNDLFLMNIEKRFVIYPRFKSCQYFNEVPERYNKDYQEARAVLEISPKASAALSRRILQDILHNQHNIKKSDLSKEIEEFISLPNVPSSLIQAIDAVRQIGNFAAHPKKVFNTGCILEVEPGEAEWLIEVIQELFDFTYVRPARALARKKSLEEKLASLKKPNA